MSKHSSNNSPQLISETPEMQEWIAFLQEQEALREEQQFQKDKEDHGILKAIRNRAKARGYSAGDLTVLSDQNDPYRLDTPANHINAQWFAEQVQRFLPTGNVHLRGMHYRCVGMFTYRLGRLTSTRMNAGSLS